MVYREIEFGVIICAEDQDQKIMPTRDSMNAGQTLRLDVMILSKRRIDGLTQHYFPFLNHL